MSNFWIVRAGEGGYLAPAFDKAGVVGMGWRGAGDFTHLREIDEFKERVAADPDVKTGAIPNSASMAYKFRHVIAKGDDIVTYDPARREYLVGTVVSDYEYRKDVLPDYDHLRHVQWKGRVSRDALTPSSRNRLGSTLSLFQPGDEVWQEIQTVLQSGAGELPAEEAPDEVRDEFQTIRQDVVEKAHEFIKDRILALSPEEMEILTAAVLRAMGYKARVTPKGADRGRDVIASPDGLGFQQPRIIAEVKHRRRDPMGAERIRSFLGGLRSGDSGLYVSTGGFTREPSMRPTAPPSPSPLWTWTLWRRW